VGKAVIMQTSPIYLDSITNFDPSHILSLSLFSSTYYIAIGMILCPAMHFAWGDMYVFNQLWLAWWIAIMTAELGNLYTIRKKL
jgi:hypothetical protein